MSGDKMIPTGKLYTSNPAGLRNNKNEDAELWLITRSGPDVPNTKLVRSLAPSPSLFNDYLSKWRNRPPELWWKFYEPAFLHELQSQEKMAELRNIYRHLLQGKDVVLICFCKDHRYCHRRLVGEFFKPYGVLAEELNPLVEDAGDDDHVEQISFF